MKKSNTLFLFLYVIASLFSVPVQASQKTEEDIGYLSTIIECRTPEIEDSSGLEQAGRAAVLLKSAIQMPQNGQYTGLFHSIGSENGSYQGVVGKALLFHTGKKASFYKFSETNTYAFPVTFQIFSKTGVELEQAGMKNQIAVNSMEEPIVKLDADTDYYLVIYTQNRKSSETGTVSVSISEVEDDYPDQMAQAQAVSFDSQVYGTLEGYGDKDCFRIAADDKKAYYRILLRNSSAERLMVSLYDQNGVLAESPWIISNSATKEADLKLTPSAIYYICISGNKETCLGTYSFCVSREPDDVGDTVLDAAKLNLDSSFCGSIQGDEDVDMVSFNCGTAGACEIKITNLSEAGSLKYKVLTPGGKILKYGTLDAGLVRDEILRGLQEETSYYVQITGKAGVSYKVEAAFVKHKITYCLNGGKNSEKNPGYFVETKNLKLYPAKRKGYTFCGWHREKQLENKIKSISNTEKSPIALYAKWKKVKTGRTQIQKVKRMGKAIKVTYSRVKQAKGYQISCASSKSFRNAKKTDAHGTQKKIIGIKKGKPYFIRVRAYQSDSTGENIYGKWSRIYKLPA